MGDAVFSAAREIWGLVLAAATDPGPWLVAGLVFGAAATAVFVRGKMAWALWLPILAAAAYLAWRRFHTY
jgi:hypothetical protein